LAFLCIIFIVSAIISKNAFKNGKPTCDAYIINAYLYIFLGLTIVGYVGNRGSECNFSTLFLVACALGSILSIIMIGLTPQSNFFLSHGLWIFFTICLGFILSVALKNASRKTMREAIIISLIIFFSMTCLAVIGHNRLVKHLGNIGMILFYSLVSVILLELYYIFFKDYTRQIQKNISYVVIVLFSAFLVYDTVLLRERSKLCSNTSNPANYPKESLNIILDVLNLFVRLQNVLRP
jgi:FtsH-binding integral membrane protein